jgi:hypothetical protein
MDGIAEPIFILLRKVFVLDLYNIIDSKQTIVCAAKKIPLSLRVIIEDQSLHILIQIFQAFEQVCHSRPHNLG